MKTSNQAGSHVIAVTLFLLAVGVIGFAGYRVYQMQQPAATTDTSASTAAVPASIKNTASLNQAASSLDSVSTQLNSNLDDSSLDADINSML